jgi:CHASE2 domain-containing sensor protein
VSEPPETALPAPLVTPRRPRWWRRLVLGLAVLVVLALVAVLGGGWYYADQIMARPHADPASRATIVAIDRTGTAATLRLRGPALAGQP